jgi:uncharacterized membrane protein
MPIGLKGEPLNTSPGALFSFALRSLLCTFAALCLVLVFLLPPFQGPDELNQWNHALRRYHQVLQGGYYCGKDVWLGGYFEDYRIRFHPAEKMATGKFEKSDQIAVNCGPYPTLSYPIGTYVPLVLAKALVKGEETSGVAAIKEYYLSKILGACIAILVIARVFAMSKGFAKGKQGIFVAGGLILSPLFAQQVTVVSADFSIYMASIGILVLLLSQKRIAILDLFWIFYFAIAASATKPVMIPVLFVGGMCHAYVNWVTNSKNRHYFTILVLLTLCIPGAFLAQSLLHPVPMGFPGWANPTLQIDFVLANPIAALRYITESSLHYLSFDRLSGGLGWLAVSVNSIDTSVSTQTKSLWSYFLFGTLLFEATYYICARPKALIEPIKSTKKNHQNIFWILGIFACAAGVFGSALAMYLAFTPPGKPSVEGIQARYFLPFVLVATVLVFCMIPRFQKLDQLFEVMSKSFVCRQINQKKVAVFRSVVFISFGALSIAFLQSVSWDLLVRYW